MTKARSFLALVLCLSLLVSAATASETPTDQYICDQALALFQSDDYEAGFKLIALGLEEYPDSVALYKLLGGIHYHLEQYKDAYDAYHHAAELDPKNFEHFLCEADALYFQGLYSEAAASYSRAIDLNPEMGYLYGCRGDARYLQGNFEDALTDYQKQLDLGETSEESQIRLRFAQEALARSIPFPESDEKITVDAQGHADLTNYFQGGDIPSAATMLSFMVYARMQGLTVGGALFPVLQLDSDGRASADHSISDGVFINVPFGSDKQVLGYILYQQYDAPLYPHAAKFGDALITAVCGGTPPVSYAQLKTVQFAQRRWEPLAQTYGDWEFTLYFLDGWEGLLIQAK